MDATWRTILWQQFGAAIDMLDNALRACPDPLWRDRLWHNPSEKPQYAQFWYLAYHTLFWLDFYLSGSAEGFVYFDVADTRSCPTCVLVVELLDPSTESMTSLTVSIPWKR